MYFQDLSIYYVCYIIIRILIIKVYMRFIFIDFYDEIYKWQEIGVWFIFGRVMEIFGLIINKISGT